MKKNNGMILVLSLWILSILAVFAALIGAGVRQKITLVSRLEKREAVHFLAKAGIQKARALLKNISSKNEWRNNAVERKMLQFNNFRLFRLITTPEGAAEVSYHNYDYGVGNPVVMYGVEDEERKLNINTASVDEMKRLFHIVAGLNEEDSLDLANAILDWRTVLEQEIVGFYGDEYYRNLNFPYEPKKENFEVLEEVLFVKGMNPDVFRRVKDFITVYGDGRVNVNTASFPVLSALGMPDEVARLLIAARNGNDGVPATEDDMIFNDNNISIQLPGLQNLKPKQLAHIDRLYVDKKLSTKSNFFHIHSEAVLLPNKEIRFVDCVIDGKDGRMLAWREY